MPPPPPGDLLEKILGPWPTNHFGPSGCSAHEAKKNGHGAAARGVGVRVGVLQRRRHQCGGAVRGVVGEGAQHRGRGVGRGLRNGGPQRRRSLTGAQSGRRLPTPGSGP